MRLREWKDRLKFDKEFTEKDFDIDCGVFWMWEKVLEKEDFEFLEMYYVDLQTRRFEGKIKVGEVQRTIQAFLFTRMNTDTVSKLMKVAGRMRGIQFLRSLGWKKRY